MGEFLDFAYAAKAWVAGVVAAVGQVVTLVQVAAADEAITFDKAEGIRVAVIAALSTVAAAWAVFQRKNAPGPR